MNIYCFNCKKKMNTEEERNAIFECAGDATQLKYCLCNYCKKKQEEHKKYIESFLEE
jgi:hypothetical protein